MNSVMLRVLLPALAGGLVLTGLTACSRDVASTATELALDRLAVVVRPTNDGSYRRAAFGRAWADTDHNSCNQRDDALLAAVDKLRPFTAREQGDCDHDMVAGTWHDPYSGQSRTFGDLKMQTQAMAIPIDHIVALGVSWRYGASHWTPERRLEFATDLNNLQPTTARINAIKSDHDAASWRPSEPRQCAYASRYIQIKQTYGLPVDSSERRALREMLDTC